MIEKAGSRKTGYQYCIASSSNLIVSMLQRFIMINQEFIARLETLSARIQKRDTSLKNALDAELEGARLWNRALGMVLKSLGAEVEED